MQTTDITQIISFVKSKMCHFQIITIDGTIRSGKSFLAATLADELNIPTFEVDEYIERKISVNTNYKQSLCFSNLSKDVNEHIISNLSIIIEGICILDVTDGLGIKPTITIYTDKITVSPISGTIHGKTSDIANEDVPPTCPISYPTSLYHKARMPKDNADITYEWIYSSSCI